MSSPRLDHDIISSLHQWISTPCRLLPPLFSCHLLSHLPLSTTLTYSSPTLVLSTALSSVCHLYYSSQHLYYSSQHLSPLTPRQSDDSINIVYYLVNYFFDFYTFVFYNIISRPICSLSSWIFLWLLHCFVHFALAFVINSSSTSFTNSLFPPNLRKLSNAMQLSIVFTYLQPFLLSSRPTGTLNISPNISPTFGSLTLTLYCHRATFILNHNFHMRSVLSIGSQLLSTLLIHSPSSHLQRLPICPVSSHLAF